MARDWLETTFLRPTCRSSFVPQSFSAARGNAKQVLTMSIRTVLRAETETTTINLFQIHLDALKPRCSATTLNVLSGMEDIWTRNSVTLIQLQKFSYTVSKRIKKKAIANRGSCIDVLVQNAKIIYRLTANSLIHCLLYLCHKGLRAVFMLFRP